MISNFHLVPVEVDVFSNIAWLKQVLTNVISVITIMQSASEELSDDMTQRINEIMNESTVGCHQASSQVHSVRSSYSRSHYRCMHRRVCNQERVRLRALSQEPIISLKKTALSKCLHDNTDMKKVLIYSQNLETLKELHKYLGEKAVSCKLFGGSVMSRNSMIKCYNLANPFVSY